MIQAINSVNTNSYKKQNTSFKKQDIQEQVGAIYKPPSKAKRLANYLGTQFVAGAIISGILDGTINLINVVRKKPVMPIKQLAFNATYLGVVFVVAGAVFAGVDSILAKAKAKKSNPVV